MSTCQSLISRPPRSALKRGSWRKHIDNYCKFHGAACSEGNTEWTLRVRCVKVCLLCPVQKGRVGGLHGVQGFTETDRDGEGRKEGVLTGRHPGQSENPAKMWPQLQEWGWGVEGEGQGQKTSGEWRWSVGRLVSCAEIPSDCWIRGGLLVPGRPASVVLK